MIVDVFWREGKEIWTAKADFPLGRDSGFIKIAGTRKMVDELPDEATAQRVLIQAYVPKVAFAA